MRYRELCYAVLAGALGWLVVIVVDAMHWPFWSLVALALFAGVFVATFRNWIERGDTK